MRVQFIGVGEAFDETLPNNSQLLEWNSCRLLIDCGYAVPHALWKLHPDPEFINAVYISHRHADHYFGLPSYLVRLAEDGRKRDIDILCPKGTTRVILKMIDYAYQGILANLDLQVHFHEVTTEEPFEYLGAKMEFAVSSHPVRNFAIAVTAEGRKYAYSGDGNFNEHTRRLYLGSSLLVHEAYGWENAEHGHARIVDVLQMAKEQGVSRVALTHLQRGVRRSRRKEIEDLIRSTGVNAFLPEPGEICDV